MSFISRVQPFTSSHEEASMLGPQTYRLGLNEVLDRFIAECEEQGLVADPLNPLTSLLMCIRMTLYYHQAPYHNPLVIDQETFETYRERIIAKIKSYQQTHHIPTLNPFLDEFMTELEPMLGYLSREDLMTTLTRNMREQGWGEMNPHDLTRDMLITLREPVVADLTVTRNALRDITLGTSFPASKLVKS